MNFFLRTHIISPLIHNDNYLSIIYHLNQSKIFQNLNTAQILHQILPIWRPKALISLSNLDKLSHHREQISNKKKKKTKTKTKTKRKKKLTSSRKINIKHLETKINKKKKLTQKEKKKKKPGSVVKGWSVAEGWSVAGWCDWSVIDVWIDAKDESATATWGYGSDGRRKVTGGRWSIANAKEGEASLATWSEVESESVWGREWVSSNEWGKKMSWLIDI